MAKHKLLNPERSLTRTITKTRKILQNAVKSDKVITSLNPCLKRGYIWKSLINATLAQW
jgi:hypothetical protein